MNHLYHPNVDKYEWDDDIYVPEYRITKLQKKEDYYKCNELFLKFGDEFPLTDDERTLIDGLTNHPLIKDLIVKQEWTNTVTVY